MLVACGTGGAGSMLKKATRLKNESSTYVGNACHAAVAFPLSTENPQATKSVGITASL
jgi:hypothetical protein